MYNLILNCELQIMNYFIEYVTEHVFVDKIEMLNSHFRADMLYRPINIYTSTANGYILG